MRVGVIIILLFISFLQGNAQQDSIAIDTSSISPVNKSGAKPPKEEIIKDARFDDGRMIYRYATLGGLGLHTSGFNLWFRKYKSNGWYKSNFWQIDYASMKHPKEIKISPFEGERSYVFGKINGLNILRGTYGYQKLLFEKEEFKGVQVGFNISGGLSLGLVKPKYLEVEFPFVQTGAKAVIERYDTEVHDRTKIIGGAPFTYGLDELNFYPGLHLKASMYVDYSPMYQYLRSIEFGLMADVFYKDVPIMAFSDNNFLFVNFFASWQFGKRYNTKS